MVMVSLHSNKTLRQQRSKCYIKKAKPKNLCGRQRNIDKVKVNRHFFIQIIAENFPKLSKLK